MRMLLLNGTEKAVIGWFREGCVTINCKRKACGWYKNGYYLKQIKDSVYTEIGFWWLEKGLHQIPTKDTIKTINMGDNNEC